MKDTKIINMGNTDFFTASKKNIDFAWVYYGWTGIEAETRNIDVNMQYLIDYDKNLDYYTPVVIANEKYLKSNGETAKKFMTALKEGYEYSIKHDKESADILMKSVPELKNKKISSMHHKNICHLNIRMMRNTGVIRKSASGRILGSL